MRHGRQLALVAAVVLAISIPARADDAADARALVDKALKAHGGLEALAKHPAITIKFKATFHGMGMAIPMTGEVVSDGPSRHKVEAEVEAGGQKFRFVMVYAGDKGWTRLGDQTTEMDKDALAEAKEEAHAGWVATLVPLRDKAYTLATVGEVKVADRPALGVKVSRKGFRDVDLYFDKESGLLVKTESRVKDEGTGQEVTEETVLADYKEVQGTKQAMKFTVHRDGKLFMEGEVTDYTLAEKLDAATFAKP